MKPILFAALALSLPLALPLSAVAADGPDDLWEITMKMEMAGMPMSMPAQTNTVCTPRGSPDDRMVPMDKSCKLIEQKRTASRLTFRYTCKDERSIYTGSGEMEFLGKDAYKGKMHAVGMMEGEQVDMTNTWSGKRLGNCTYEDPAKKVEQYRAASNAQIAKACDEAMDALATQLFFGDSAICKERKAEFCTRAGKIADELQRDPGAFKRHAQKDWRGAMKACGKDPEPVMAKACGAALAKRDGDFLKDYCPAEAVAARKQFCLGRTYTSVEASARELCSALGGLSYTADAPAAAPAADPKSSIGDKLKDGASKLKKFLKF